MEIKESFYAYFKINGNLLTKEFKEEQLHLNEEWFYYYNQYQIMFPYTVKIHEYSTKHLVMDYINEPTLNNIFENKIVGSSIQETKTIINNVHKNVHEIIASFYEFALHVNKGFWHTDLNSTNIILSDPMKLIDPNSFKLDEFVRLNTDDILMVIIQKSYLNKHINERIYKTKLEIEHFE